MARISVSSRIRGISAAKLSLSMTHKHALIQPDKGQPATAIHLVEHLLDVLVHCYTVVRRTPLPKFIVNLYFVTAINHESLDVTGESVLLSGGRLPLISPNGLPLGVLEANAKAADACK